MHAQENALASKRSNRKRGAPATALDAITEEAEPDEKAIPEPEAPPQAEAALQKAPDISAQEASGARSKAPLPGRARRGRAARDEEGENGTQNNSHHALVLQCHSYVCSALQANDISHLPQILSPQLALNLDAPLLAARSAVF